MQSSTARPEVDARAGSRGPDFIGIGAQRAGTSWIYACLFEHPELCLPQKEINFFSRERNWSRGFGWYEAIFGECPGAATVGEFSTSYLTDAETPGRIRERYPSVRLIVSLRNPADRAYSNYLNDIVAGIVPPSVGFSEALGAHPEYIEGGRYAHYLPRYLDLFGPEQLLVSIFDDARREPLAAIQSMYAFLGVDPGFRPALIDRPVGTGRVPRMQWLERRLIDTGGAFRRSRFLRPIWWRAKQLGIGDRLRALNTTSEAANGGGLQAADRETLAAQFEPEIATLERLLDRDLSEWRS
jgi:hypothetical protein